MAWGSWVLPVRPCPQATPYRFPFGLPLWPPTRLALVVSPPMPKLSGQPPPPWTASRAPSPAALPPGVCLAQSLSGPDHHLLLLLLPRGAMWGHRDQVSSSPIPRVSAPPSSSRFCPPFQPLNLLRASPHMGSLGLPWTGKSDHSSTRLSSCPRRNQPSHLSSCPRSQASRRFSATSLLTTPGKGRSLGNWHRNTFSFLPLTSCLSWASLPILGLSLSPLPLLGGPASLSAGWAQLSNCPTTRPSRPCPPAHLLKLPSLLSPLPGLPALLLLLLLRCLPGHPWRWLDLNPHPQTSLSLTTSLLRPARRWRWLLRSRGGWWCRGGQPCPRRRLLPSQPCRSPHRNRHRHLHPPSCLPPCLAQDRYRSSPLPPWLPRPLPMGRGPRRSSSTARALPRMISCPQAPRVSMGAPSPRSASRFCSRPKPMQRMG